MKRPHQKFDIGIRCDYFLSMSGGKASPETNIFIGICKNTIAEISPWKPAHKKACRKFIYSKNHVALPGLINGHTHLAMTLFRGLEDDLPLKEWLFDRILPLEARLVDPEFVQVGTELALLECIRFGTTLVNEMYFFAEKIAETVDRSGIRAFISQIFGAIPFPEDKVLGTDKIRLFENFWARFQDHPRITPTLGPHALYTCNEEVIRQVARLSEKYKAPIHIHLSETEFEVRDWLMQTGQSPVKSLSELGALTRHTLCAHCVHLNDEDIELLKDSGAITIYNPDSNLKLGSGVAPIVTYLSKGIPVLFGTDGSASNNDLSLWGALDVGTKLQKMICHDTSAMSAEEALWCTTGGAAQALGLESQIGTLEVGKKADLILVDFNHPHLHPIHNIVSHLVYATQGLEVDTVVCDGKILMKNKEILTLDSERILQKASKIRAKIQNELKKI